MGKSSGQGEEDRRELTLIGHLDELRYRLIVCIAALFIATLVSFFFARPVLEVLIKPAASEGPFAAKVEKQATIRLHVAADGSVSIRDLNKLAELDTAKIEPHLVLALAGTDERTTRTLSLTSRKDGAELIYTNPIDPFMMPFKVAIIMGILLSLTVWVFQIWRFVAPGLTAPERKVVGPMLSGAIILFPVGSGFAYLLFFFLIPVMRGYIVPGIDTLYTIRDYLKLMTNMMIVFGVVFELPLVIAVLARIGIVTPAFLSHYRRHIYVVLAIVAMLITPADPISMLIALIPLVLLFECSVWVSRIMWMMRERDENETTS